MLFGKYTFLCQWENTAILPYYKGSTFRGVFGHALKKIACGVKGEKCESCMLKGQCVYAVVFETAMAVKPPPNAKIPAVPHPFVIEPPMTPQTRFNRGETFEFNLILFGRANDYFAYFIYAFELMGQMGIGQAINGVRGTYILREIRQDGRVLFDKAQSRLISEPDPTNLTLPSIQKASRYGTSSETTSRKNAPRQTAPSDSQSSDNPASEKSTITITLQTPLRLKYKNRFTAELPFHLLTRAMLRRADALLQCHGKNPPLLDFKGMVQRAEKINILDSTLDWFDWKRYSGRQDQKMLMGGILGTITYEGRLDEFIPLIDFCTKTHIGKQTAFGLGKIERLPWQRLFPDPRKTLEP